MPPGAAALDHDPALAQRNMMPGAAEQTAFRSAERFAVPPAPGINIEHSEQTLHTIGHRHHDGCCADHPSSAETLIASPTLKQEEHRCGADCHHHHNNDPAHNNPHVHNEKKTEVYSILSKSQVHEHAHNCGPDCPEHKPHSLLEHKSHPVGCDCPAHRHIEDKPTYEAAAAAVKQEPPKQPQIETETVPAAVLAHAANEQSMAALHKTLTEKPVDKPHPAPAPKQTTKPEPVISQSKKTAVLKVEVPPQPPQEQAQEAEPATQTLRPAEELPPVVNEILAAEPEQSTAPADSIVYEQSPERPAEQLADIDTAAEAELALSQLIEPNPAEFQPTAIPQMELPSIHPETSAEHSAIPEAAVLPAPQTAETAVVAIAPKLESSPVVVRAVAEVVVAAPPEVREEAQQLLAQIESLAVKVMAADSPEARLLMPVVQDKIVALSRLLNVDPSELMRLLEIDPSHQTVAGGTAETLSQLQLLLHEDQRVKVLAAANPAPTGKPTKRQPFWDYVGDTVLNLAGRLRRRVAASAQ